MSKLPLRSPLLVLLAIGLIALIGLLTQELSSPSSPALAQANGVQVTPPRFDCGPVGHMEKRLLRFRVENKGSSPIEITRAKESCSCIVPKFEPGVIQPGEFREGTAVVTFGRMIGSRFKKRIDFLGPRGSRLQSFTIFADCHLGVKVSSRNIELYRSLSGPMPDEEGSVVITGGKVTDLEVVNVTKGIQVEARQEDLPDGTVKLTAKLVDSPPGRPASAKLNMKINGHAATFPVKARTFESLVVLPVTLSFQSVRTEQSEPQWLDVYDPSGAPFEITDVNYTLVRKGVGDVVTEVLPRAGGGYRVKAVATRKNAPAGGQVLGTLKFNTTHSTRPTFEVRCFGMLRPIKSSN